MLKQPKRRDWAEEINTAGQTKWESDFWRSKRPFSNFFYNKHLKKKNPFAEWLIELANRGFGLSTDAFMKSVKEFLDK